MPPATTVADTNNLGEGDSYLVLDLLSDDEDWMKKKYSVYHVQSCLLL